MKKDPPEQSDRIIGGAPPLPAPGSVSADSKESDKPVDLDSDPAIDEAVNDIAVEESDEVLAAEDAEVAKAFEDKPQTFGQKVRSFFSSWWHNKPARYATITVLLAICIGLAAVPQSRYFVLNTVGARGNASLTVLDNSTQQPLKNVQVQLANQTLQTDDNGVATFTHIKFGPEPLTIEKRAFASQTKTVTIGLGKNYLGNFKIVPTGAQYIFVAKDFLSHKPIVKAQAESGEANAQSDKDGKIVLTLDNKNQDTVEVIIKADTYRDEKVQLDLNSKAEQEVLLVPARKHAFVSKRTGTYDVYKIDIDGKNERRVLAGTGTEKDDITLVQHPTSNIVGLVSSRDNIHNADGYLLSTLSILNLNDNSKVSLGHSEQYQVIGWAGDRLVYVQIIAGASASNPKRERLMSYDYKTNVSKELAATNYFNDVMMIGGDIYYAPSGAYQNGVNVSLFKVGADGNNKQVVLAREIWNIFRKDYNNLLLTIQQDWYNYVIGDPTPSKLTTAPVAPKTRVYIDSPDKKHSLWVDSRDGKGVLIAYNLATQNDKILQEQTGLTYPLDWANNSTVIYRVSNENETADYALSLNGGSSRKIRDVTKTSGIDKWYYY